jgi:TPR repeat protein
MNRIVLAVALFASLTKPVWAGPEEGLAAYQAGDYETAHKEFSPLAEQGHTNAQLILGIMYLNGQGVQQDDAEAVKWWRRAAELGHDGAQFYLGVVYVKGQGVQQDDAKAVNWWRRAAEQGHDVAQSYLGVMYLKGQGVQQDYVRAHLWFDLAAAHESDDASKNLQLVSKKMTRAQIAEAKRLAREWKPKPE